MDKQTQVIYLMYLLVFEEFFLFPRLSIMALNN